MAAHPSAVTALRSNRLVVYSVVAAAAALVACALLAIAWMLGWLPGGAPAALRAASPARQAAGNATDDALLPGETLVAPADLSQRREPLMPSYSRPTPPAPAPAATEAEARLQAPSPAAPPRRAARPTLPEPRAPVTNPDALPTSPTEPLRAGRHDPYVTDPGRAGPQTPSFARSRERYAEGRYEQPPRSRLAAPCRECGRVQSITSSYPGLWDVRVRLDDGGGRVFRFRDVPPFHIGDRVRTDDGRLMHD